MNLIKPVNEHCTCAVFKGEIVREKLKMLVLMVLVILVLGGALLGAALLVSRNPSGSLTAFIVAAVALIGFIWIYLDPDN